VVGLADALEGQCILVAGLAGGQHVEVLQALVLDQRLGQGGVAIDDVDEVIHHAALAADDQVQITQTDVEVDDGGLVPEQGEAGTDGGAGSRRADATLAGSEYAELGQGDSPQIWMLGTSAELASGLPVGPENSRKYPLKAGYVHHVARQADLYRFRPERVAS